MHASHQDLEQNELVFLRQHRSAIFDCGYGTAFVSSDPAPLTWNFVGALRSSATGVDEAIDRTGQLFADWNRTPCVKVTPMTEPEEWPARLERRGWVRSVRLTHMVLDAVFDGGADITVRACEGADDIARFSDVQSEGFGVPQWRSWVHKINLINASRTDQCFYLAEADGEIAGVCLVLRTGSVAGLYAVATLERHRRRGVARALIARAATDARAHGCETLCLNTASAGAAEAAFQRVGFRSVFESVFYTPERDVR